MDDSPFLIVGGGIAGLAASLGLASAGRPSIILEKASGFEAVGAGLQLGPNAVHALQKLGAWDAVAPHCVSPNEIHVRDGISGKILQRVILGTGFESRFGAPYRVAHRADLQNGLLACVGAKSKIRIETSAEVETVSIAETTLTLKSGNRLAGEAIIAADGVHSKIRNHISSQAKIRPNIHTLFRSLMPIGSIPAGIEADVVTLWLYPGGHVVHYAVSQGKQFNIVACAENSAASPGTAFAQACKPLADILGLQKNWSQWPACEIYPDPNWCQNRTVLIGDAAHASLPYLAQGAAMALEDACLLASKIKNSRYLPSALEEFTQQRFPRASAVQKKSRQLGKIYHAHGFIRLARNFVLKATPPDTFMGEASWLYDWKTNAG
jgi:salicylate hydroxylase